MSYRMPPSMGPKEDPQLIKSMARPDIFPKETMPKHSPMIRD